VRRGSADAELPCKVQRNARTGASELADVGHLEFWHVVGHPGHIGPPGAGKGARWLPNQFNWLPPIHPAKNAPATSHFLGACTAAEFLAGF
jgi:hypothetical protein